MVLLELFNLIELRIISYDIRSGIIFEAQQEDHSIKFLPRRVYTNMDLVRSQRQEKCLP